MTHLYTLYDALISSNVPNDRARAVVEAMEQDMGTTLATKTDLDSLRVATRADLEALRAAGKQDVAPLQKDLDAKYLLLRQELESLRTGVRQDIEAMRSSMIIWLGSTQIVGLSLLFAALRLT